MCTIYAVVDSNCQAYVFQPCIVSTVLVQQPSCAQYAPVVCICVVLLIFVLSESLSIYSAGK